MSTNAPRILVVDDELGIREGCRKVLSLEGYEVTTAEDGMEGLRLFQEQGDFAVALIDLKMPRMDGIELIEQIRRRDQDVVLFVITAYATIETAVEATKRGANGYIPKPFTPDELLLPIRNGLEHRALSIETRRLREERERRLLEVAYERSKSSTIINCMTDGVLVINREAQIVLRNAAMGRIVPAVGRCAIPAPLSLLGCAEMEGLLRETLSSTSTRTIVSKEIQFDKSTYMANVSPVLEPNGEVLGAVAVLRDISALKKLETAKSMFVSMVAHEVKSPLAAIEGYLDVILSGAAGVDSPKARSMIERALVRARTLRTMISELISLVAIETGKFTFKRSPMDLGDVLKEVVETYREKAEQKQITLDLTCEQGAAYHRILADRQAMLSVFGNLVDNAIKYTNEGGRVGVRLATDGNYVQATVEDNGIGMSPDETERVFDEFYRARNEQTAKVPGTGLGLTLVKRLLELHHGRITVRSAPGVGSTFTVSLPLFE